MEILAFFGMLTLILCLIVYGVLLWGFVCWKFWYWFIIPIFPELPELNFIHAAAIMLFISLFHEHSSQVIKKEYKDESSSLLVGIISPWSVLFIGWIFKILFL